MFAIDISHQLLHDTALAAYNIREDKHHIETLDTYGRQLIAKLSQFLPESRFNYQECINCYATIHNVQNNATETEILFKALEFYMGQLSYSAKMALDDNFENNKILSQFLSNLKSTFVIKDKLSCII
jgi:hypothetical protein